MSFWKWDAPSKFGTFEEAPLHDGALKDALVGMAKGDSPPLAIIKAVFTKGVPMNHENVSAAQAVVTGIGAVVHIFAPQYDAQVLGIAGALFALLGVLKPFLPPKVQGAF